MLGIAHHKFRYGEARIKIFEEDRAELTRNGHFYAIFLCQEEGRFSSGHTLGNAFRGLENLRECLSSSQTTAKLLIAAQWCGTGCDKIANASQASKGHRMRACCLAQARNLGQSSRNNGGFGIFTAAHTIID